MKAVAVLLTLVGVAHSLTYGPCHNVPTVEVDNSRWSGALYVNVHYDNAGARCEYVERYLINEGGKVYLGDTFKHIENDQVLQSNWKGERVGKGHYTFTTLVGGQNTTYHTFFVHFDPPTLTCHYACTDDPRNANQKGQLFCEGPSPDALQQNAAKIKQIAQNSGFNTDELMIIDNCDCPNIPYTNGPSKCQHTTAKKYFKNA